MSKNKLSYWKNHPGSAILRLLVWLSAIITVAVMAFLVGFILIKGVGNLTPDLFALEYNSDNASLMPALINTLIITLLSYEDGTVARLSYEFLRVHSPSAEVTGHGPGQDVLQVGKKHVEIEMLEPIGNYALKIAFSDGHDSGLYSWDYLEKLVANQDRVWKEYLNKLEAAGASCEPSANDKPVQKNTCGSHSGHSCGCKK